MFLPLNDRSSTTSGASGPSKALDARAKYDGSIVYSTGGNWQTGDRSIVFQTKGLTNDIIDCGTKIRDNVFKGVSALTISMRAKRQAAGGCGLVGCWDSNSVQVGHGPFTDGAFYWIVTGSQFGSVAGLNDTAWRTSTMVFDGTKTGNSNRLRGWVSRKEQTLSYTGTIPTTTDSVSTSDFTIGPYGPTAKSGNSQFEYIAVWSRALSPQEVIRFESAPYSVLLPAPSKLTFMVSGIGVTLSKVLSDSITSSDSELFTVSKGLSDLVTPTDATISSVSKALVDFAMTSDSTATSASKALADTVTPADSLSTSSFSSPSDVVTPADSAAVHVSKAFADAVTTSDMMHVHDTIVLGGDHVTTSDLLSFVKSLLLSDTVSPIDSVEMALPTPTLLGEDSTTGPVTGDKPITLLGFLLDESGVEDKFTSSTIDPSLWSPSVLAGSATVQSISSSPRGVLQFSSGAATNSSAYLRSLMSYVKFDVTTQVKLSALQLRTALASVSYSLGAYVSGTTFLRAVVQIQRSSSSLTVSAVQNGITVQQAMIPLRSVTSFKLRLLRVDETFFVFLNDALIFTSKWATSSAFIEIGSGNGSVAGTTITASITKYLRNPVILFGSKPMLKVEMRSFDRLDGLTPAQDRAGSQPIHVFVDSPTQSFSYDMPVQYSYTPVYDYRRIGFSGPSSFVDVSDTAVRNS